MSEQFKLYTKKKNLKLRAQIMTAIRDFFTTGDYLEVETPVRIPAPAPEAHIDAVASGDWYLQTSPELCMKRLLAAGYERIFQICKCFRHKERGRVHLPEMTLLEWYIAHADYLDMMKSCEALIGKILETLGRTKALTYQGRKIDLTPSWRRLRVASAFERYGSVSMQAALKDNRFDEIMGLEIEPNLGWDKPVFIFDYPIECGALARRKASQPEIAERFELYIGGLELCNAFSELTDPEEQRLRFESELAARSSAGSPSWPLPETFLTALKDMPPATGNALGIDRLVMLLANTDSIGDVVAFAPEDT
ncbi:MAG: EF-P lysine aminoacylase GenX [Desulfobacteraceae bacterium]|nr:EF-P lysine aminoacylase GenX [Desulfobacteraceae bacterium]